MTYQHYRANRRKNWDLKLYLYTFLAGFLKKKKKKAKKQHVRLYFDKVQYKKSELRSNNTKKGKNKCSMFTNYCKNNIKELKFSWRKNTKHVQS